MKIQLKRSNVLDGGSAKPPLADQMEYGELAVNYNNTEPTIFLKTSTNEIVTIAGGPGGSSANLQTVTTAGNFTDTSILIGGTAAAPILTLDSTGLIITNSFFRSNRTAAADVTFEGQLSGAITSKLNAQGGLALGGTIDSTTTQTTANIFLNGDTGAGRFITASTSGTATFAGLTSHTAGINVNSSAIVLNANGSGTFSSKVTSAATSSDDSSTTLVTKGYVDASGSVSGDGALTIQTAGQGASASGSFTANQSGASTLTLPTIRYGDLSGTPSIPSAANNGTITITQPGNSTQTFTVNQSGNTTISLRNDNTAGATPSLQQVTSAGSSTSTGASFGGVTTHSGGLTIAGGSAGSVGSGLSGTSSMTQIIASSTTVASFQVGGIGLGNVGTPDVDVSITPVPDVSNSSCLLVTKGGTGNGSDLRVMYSQPNPDNGASCNIYGLYISSPSGASGRSLNGNAYGTHVTQNLGLYGPGGVTYAHYCNINSSGSRQNFNFYAAGNAPNFLNGTIQSPGTYNNISSSAINYVIISGTGLMLRSTSSRRYKDNIKDYAKSGSSTALDLVSKMKPRVWEDYTTGETNMGFIAEELYELGGSNLVSFSTWGRKTTVDEEDDGKTVENKTVIEYPYIGNGTTPVTKDGKALTDDSEVVDGLNHGAITITLVQALQEALIRIEALEKA